MTGPFARSLLTLATSHSWATGDLAVRLIVDQEGGAGAGTAGVGATAGEPAGCRCGRGRCRRGGCHGGAGWSRMMLPGAGAVTPGGRIPEGRSMGDPVVTGRRPLFRR